MEKIVLPFTENQLNAIRERGWCSDMVFEKLITQATWAIRFSEEIVRLQAQIKRILAAMECDTIDEAVATWEAHVENSLWAGAQIRWHTGFANATWPSHRERALFIAMQARIDQLEAVLNTIY